MELEDRRVELRGTDGQYVLAVWTDAGYSYAVSCTSGQTLEQWRAMLQ